MPLLAGDIRFARSANMADVPEGGGPPSAQLLTSGRSNQIFPDISEETRTVGRVEIYQVFGVLRNTDRTPLLGTNVILAEPPADPNVSITLLSLKDPFATRAQIAQRIEAGMSPGPEWAGYLLENHFATMRSVTLLQRPGMSPPTIGRTYLLILNEGQVGERRQRIRIKTTATTTRVFTEAVGNAVVDFEAQVTVCELFDGLVLDFPGSPPSRFFARGANKTAMRETMYSDTGMFYGAGRLTAATEITDVWLSVDKVTTQIVPNSRTEASTVDQRPSARQVLTLATAPRKVEVGITPHTQRIKIAEENVGLVYVAQLRPLPEPGALFIDYWAMGSRYTIYDDGEGRLTGAGGGSVSYLTGALNVTLKYLPDIGSTITIAHGTRLAYTNRSGQGAQVRAPEFAFMIDSDDAWDAIVKGTLSIGYPSGGVVRTVTDDGNGKFTGAGTGVVDYASRSVLLRPSLMLDPGGELQITCDLDAVVFEALTPPTPDAAGVIGLTLGQQPAPGTLSLQWATARTVSNTDGGTLTTTTAQKNSAVTYTIRSVPEYYEPPVITHANSSGGGGGGGGGGSTPLAVTWPSIALRVG